MVLYKLILYDFVRTEKVHTEIIYNIISDVVYCGLSLRVSGKMYGDHFIIVQQSSSQL